MLNMIVKFGETEPAASGIGAFNVNLKAFLFQLATFVLVLLVLKRWVFPKLVATLEERRKTLEQSLVDARKTREALSQAEDQVSKLLSQAREQADQALSDAQAQGKELVKSAEAAAEQRADRLLKEAMSQIEQEKIKLREELKGELADLVVTTTEKVLRKKIDIKEDSRLIEQSIRELK